MRNDTIRINAMEVELVDEKAEPAEKKEIKEEKKVKELSLSTFRKELVKPQTKKNG